MKESVTNGASELAAKIEGTLASLEARADGMMQPVRRSVFERYPIVFSLLTTFGLVATFLGFELLLIQTPFLYERPLLVLMLGIVTLVLTGTLYKKLG